MQKSLEKKIQEVPLYSGPVRACDIRPLGRAVTMVLRSANNKPPVELVVVTTNVTLIQQNVKAEL